MAVRSSASQSHPLSEPGVCVCVCVRACVSAGGEDACRCMRTCVYVPAYCNICVCVEFLVIKYLFVAHLSALYARP